MKDYVIGFDVGGTRIKSGGVSRGGRLLKAGTNPSGFPLGPQKLLRALVAEVERITDETGKRPAAVGVGFPGAVDPQQGVVLLPGKLKGLEGFPMVPRLRKATGLPVIADNDGRISILAESYYGLAADHDWAVTVTLGTGVGSGVKLGGQILRDPHLQFGTQLGHLVQQSLGGRLCITGARGTGELMCSATALAMQVRDGLARGIPSLLSDRYFKDPHAIDFKAVTRAAARGDR
jgi:glucokinase